MKSILWLAAGVSSFVLLALSSCSTQDDTAAKPAAPAAAAPAAKAEAKAPPAEKAQKATGEKTAEKAPEKAKAEKARGDVGLLDTEKNYLILVTKEGKLITVDFDAKSKATEIVPTAGKVADIGLGSSATVTYTKQGEKNVASAIEYKPAKGGD
jgi:hypothetical protein